MKGALITFEGCEGVGKSTQISLLKERIEKIRPVIITKEPGGTSQGLEIRKRLMAGGLSPEEELDLFISDRIIHIKEMLGPALDEGKVILCDRFSDSNIAYQGWGRGLSTHLIEKKDAEARGGLEPDLVVLLDMEPKVALERVHTRGETLTTFDAEALSFHEKVRKGFLDIAAKNAANHVVINAANDPHTVSEDIWSAVRERFFNT